MRKLVFALASTLLLASCSGSDKVEVGNKTTMKVDMVYDAGDVVRGEVVEATFKLKNTGSYPLVIGEVKGSCSCTVADKPEDPIAPGEEGIIKATVTTQAASPGSLAKTVNIMANTEPSLTQVVVKANILNK
jgi:hypothetical protein